MVDTIKTGEGKNGEGVVAARRQAVEAYLLLVFTTLCWGGNAVLSRLAVGEISPMTLVTARWGSVVLLVLIFLRPTIRKDFPILWRRPFFVIFMGASGFTLFNALFYVAAHSTTAINMGILQGSVPVFVMVGSYLVFREKISALQGIGVAITFSGVVVVVSRGELDQLKEFAINPGDFLMLAASFLYAAYALGLRRRPAVSTMGMFSGMAVVAFVISLPLYVFEVVQNGFSAPTLKGWLIVIVVTIFPSFLAQITFIFGVDRIGANRAGVFVNLVPVFASGMAVLFLGEHFEIFHGVALALVLAGIFMSEKFKIRATSPN